MTHSYSIEDKVKLEKFTERLSQLEIICAVLSRLNQHKSKANKILERYIQGMPESQIQILISFKSKERQLLDKLKEMSSDIEKDNPRLSKVVESVC